MSIFDKLKSTTVTHEGGKVVKTTASGKQTEVANHGGRKLKTDGPDNRKNANGV